MFQNYNRDRIFVLIDEKEIWKIFVLFLAARVLITSLPLQMTILHNDENTFFRVL